MTADRRADGAASIDGPGSERASDTPEPPEETAAIACTGLTRSFGATLALDHVNLTVRAGTIHALIGQNGAGKSTCLGMIAGVAVTASQLIEIVRALLAAVGVVISDPSAVAMRSA